ncbi:CBS-domain-containing protein, partial [Ramicandelaber brevisporus]
SVVSGIAPAPSETAVGSGSSDARQRQLKKDEVIRRKAEQELTRKTAAQQRQHQQQNQRSGGGGGGGGSGRNKANPGTVAALRPSMAMTVRESLTVAEAARLMAAKRADSVLVVDDDERLTGIFTAKDIAFRVVAEALDAHSVRISKIMTPSPMCVTSETSATEALNTMVMRGFRHLPVTNEDGDVIGLLDVIKCLIDALDKMERAYDSSRKLYDALEGVEREWAGAVNPSHMVHFIETMRERMACPDLTTVLETKHPEAPGGAVQVHPRTNIRDIARLMKQHRTTAVLVTENNQISGIFTSKDIVLRVIATGLDPSNCSVARVMTPHPDTAVPTMTIIDALRRMHDHHFLNLPVVDESGLILGLVDVLKLCYATLEQMRSIQSGSGAGSNGIAGSHDGFGGMDGHGEGPMWSRFFTGAPGIPDDESQSVYSETHDRNGAGSQVPYTPVRHNGSMLAPPTSEIYPHESVSMADEMSPRPLPEDFQSLPSSAPLDDGTFVFKFKSPAGNGKVHRFTSEYTSLAALKSIVTDKLRLDDSASAVGAADTLEQTGLSYLDDEDDRVLLSSDADLKEAVSLARSNGWQRIVLVLNSTPA